MPDVLSGDCPILSRGTGRTNLTVTVVGHPRSSKAATGVLKLRGGLAMPLGTDGAADRAAQISARKVFADKAARRAFKRTSRGRSSRVAVIAISWRFRHL